VAWSAPVKDRLFQHIPQVVLYDACGSTEGATYGYSILRAGDPTSTARFIAAPGVIVIDESSGRGLGVERRGLLASPSTRSGYHRDAAKSATVFRTIDGKAYTVPGDYGMCHADGTVTLLGRTSSTINSGGEKVFAEEVEHVITAIPGVEDCAVVGVPDERWNQRVTALVQRADDAAVDDEDVITAVREHLAAYKAPKQVVFGTVPRFANGKLDRETATRRVLEAFSAASDATS
jgi:fatty-acyl-CoA synthase